MSKLRQAFKAAAADVKNNFGEKAANIAGTTALGATILYVVGGTGALATGVAPVLVGAVLGAGGISAVKAGYKAYRSPSSG